MKCIPIHNVCSYCGYVQDETTPSDSAPRGPRSGDISICFNCGELSVFMDNMLQREITQDELVMALEDKVIQALVSSIKKRGLLHPRKKVN